MECISKNYFFYFSANTYAVATQKDSLYQTVLLNLFFYLFIHYFKRIAHLATLASLPCGPLDIFTYIQIHTI